VLAFCMSEPRRTCGARRGRERWLSPTRPQANQSLRPEMGRLIPRLLNGRIMGGLPNASIPLSGPPRRPITCPAPPGPRFVRALAFAAPPSMPARPKRAARTIEDAPRSAPLGVARPSAELAEVALAHATRAIGLGHLGEARGWTRMVGALRRMAMEETDCGTWAAALDRAIGATLRRRAEMADRESGLPDSARTEQSPLTASPACGIPDLPDSVDSFAESGSPTDQQPFSPIPAKRPAAVMSGDRLNKRSPKPGRTTKAVRKQPCRSKLEMARQISGLSP
jgi:hypothetical protein